MALKALKISVLFHHCLQIFISKSVRFTSHSCCVLPQQLSLLLLTMAMNDPNRTNFVRVSSSLSMEVPSFLPRRQESKASSSVGLEIVCVNGKKKGKTSKPKKIVAVESAPVGSASPFAFKRSEDYLEGVGKISDGQQEPQEKATTRSCKKRKLSFNEVCIYKPEKEKNKQTEYVIKSLDTRRKSLRELKSKAREPRNRKHGPRYSQQANIDGTLFHTGDHVYVRRKVVNDGSESDEELEDCVICGEHEGETMVECDCCLGGFHMNCVVPPLDSVPEGDWYCSICSAHGRDEKCLRQKIDETRVKKRTAKDRLFSGELSVAQITRLWRGTDGGWRVKVLYYELPEETYVGRQPYHGRRELFRTEIMDDIEMGSVVRHCYVMSPIQFARSTNDGDDVFKCAYEYHHGGQRFTRIHYSDEEDFKIDDEVSEDSEEELYKPSSQSDEEDDEEISDEDGVASITIEEEQVGQKRRRSQGKGKGTLSSNGMQHKATPSKRSVAANARKGGAGAVRATGSCKRNYKLSGLAKAQAALLPSAIPENLPCRDKERNEIESCLLQVLADGTRSLGRCLYVSGVPGTGKTATVLEVMRSLIQRSAEGSLPPFQVIHVNALRLPSPQHIFSVLYEELMGKAVSWCTAQKLLEAHFSSKKKNTNQRPLVLLVDELDHLVTRGQNVLYSLFDWPTRSSTSLTVIGIANTMDLPERLLPRIASRMGLQRCAFRPYTREQLTRIVEVRLEGTAAFQPQAIKLAAMKVAAASGDVRRALELCRRAAEAAAARMEGQSHSLVETDLQRIELQDVDTAIQEMFEAPQMQLLGRCALQEKIFLGAILIELRRSGLAETTFEKVALTHIDLCKTHGIYVPNRCTLSTISSRLGAWRLLIVERGGRRRHQKLQLNIPSDDIVFLFKKENKLPWLVVLL